MKVVHETKWHAKHKPPISLDVNANQSNKSNVWRTGQVTGHQNPQTLSARRAAICLCQIVCNLMSGMDVMRVYNVEYVAW